jgi:sulfonate transport system permease protein
MSVIQKSFQSTRSRKENKIPSDNATASRYGELLRWLVPFLIVTFWQLASSLGWLNPRVLPGPVSVVSAFWNLVETGKIWEHFFISLQRTSLGILIGAGLGFAFGLLTGLGRWLHIFFDSTFQMVRTIPALALIPLVIVWFGVGEAGKIFLIALATFFPVYINTQHGVLSIDTKLLEMGRVYGLTSWGTFRRIVLPGALPSVLVGVRYALGISWLALVVGESFGARSGIGFLAMDAREFFRTDVIVLAIVIYAFIGKAADSIVRFLEKRLLPWHTGLQKS